MQPLIANLDLPIHHSAKLSFVTSEEDVSGEDEIVVGDARYQARRPPKIGASPN